MLLAHLAVAFPFSAATILHPQAGLWGFLLSRPIHLEESFTMAASQTTVTNASSMRRTGAANGVPKGPAQTGQTEQQQDPIETDKNYRDFFWTYTEEPHRSRRLAIIKAHPEVRLP